MSVTPVVSNVIVTPTTDGTLVEFSVALTVPPPPAPEPPPVSRFPPSTTLAYVAPNSDPMPGHLTPSTDSSFGTEVTRVSGIANQRHRYSSKAVWNADESLMLLDYPPPGAASARAILDGGTYAVLHAANDTMGYFTWCNTVANKNVAWAYSGLTIRRLAVTAAGITLTSSTTLKALSGTYTAISLGGGQGSISDDDRYLAFMYKKGTTEHGIGVIDVSGPTPTVIAERFVYTSTASIGSSIVNNVGMSATGAYVVAGMGVAGTGAHLGTHIYPRTLTSDRQVTTASVHWDAGRLGDGTTDVLVICSQKAGGGGPGSQLGRYRMSDGAYTTLIPNWPGGHISTRNTGRPGWCYPSTYTAIDGGTTYPGLGTVFALNMDDPSEVQMFADVHGRTKADIAFDGYTTQPHACPSPSGERVVYATRHGGSVVYPFVARAKA